MEDKLRIDGHKLNYHSDRIMPWMKGKDIYPVYVEIGSTSICNHRCIFCALDYTGYKGKLMDTQVLLNALTEMGKNGVKSIMFGGEGEPTLHKDFSLLVEHAKKSGLDVAITTNGVPFTRKMAESCLPHLSWIKFSIDAGTPETYAKIHGTKAEDFEVLMRNIKDCVEIKKKNNLSVKIGTQALLIEENAEEMIVLAEKVKEIGADYLTIKPYSQHPDSSYKFDLDYDKFKGIQKSLEAMNSKEFSIVFRMETMSKLKKDMPYPKCYGLPFFALIDAQGNVIPCNMFYNKEDFYYGNLYDNTFTEIWSSKKRKDVIERMHKDGTGSCRENCRLDSINRYLFSLKNPPENVNFI